MLKCQLALILRKLLVKRQHGTTNNQGPDRR